MRLAKHFITFTHEFDKFNNIGTKFNNIGAQNVAFYMYFSYFETAFLV